LSAAAARALAVVALAAAVAGTLTCIDQPFSCQHTDECVHQGVQGVCESDRRCSFPDDSCPSKRRYGDYGTNHQCVADVCGQAGGPCCQAGACQAGLICREQRCVCAVALAAAGASHTCLAFADGRAACFGNNALVQLGDDTLANRTDIREVPGLTSVVAMASFANHTCAVLRSGLVSCWGDNSSGQLGDGTMANRPRPQPVSRLDHAVGVAVGAQHSCALRDDGSVLCWGDNGRGQLGDGSELSHLIPQLVPALPAPAVQIDAGELFTCARLLDGSVACWGSNLRQEIEPSNIATFPVPHLVAGVQGAVDLAVGGGHACVLESSGQVWCWGASTAGQTGRGILAMGTPPAPVTLADPASALSAGDLHTCALAGTDGVVCWGGNGSGQSGLDAPDGVALPNSTRMPGVIAVEAGGRHSCAIFRDGGMSCWGERSDGQLGDDYEVVTLKPMLVALDDAVEVGAGNAFSCARLGSMGNVACWGAGTFGRLGDPTGRSRPSPRETVSGLAGAVQIAVGGDFACGRTADGGVHCWGHGDNGQLGDGGKRTQGSPTAVLLPAPALDIAAGAAHACAVLNTGKVLCWGANGSGQADGAPDALELALPKEVTQVADVAQVTCGSEHTCVRTNGGLVSCWGNSDSGQLGLSGPGSGRGAPVVVDEIRNAVHISAGGQHTCARRADGGVQCWGAGSAGQLGSGVLTDRNPRPMDVPDLPGPATQVAAGAHFTCAISMGHVYCWGLNRDGEVGDGTQTLRSTPMAVLGLPDTPVTAIAPGASHACALTAAGDLYCWGRNRNGETGSGMALSRAAAAPVRLGCR